MLILKEVVKNKHIKKFTGDVFFNTLGFAIYIFVQQICLLPILARQTNDDSFSIVIIFISVYSIICNSIGNELGVTRQIRYEKDIEDGVNPNVYNNIVIITFPIIVIIAGFILWIFGYEIDYLLPFALTISLGNIRLYLASFFRLKKEFKKIVFQNIIYTAGAGIGILLFLFLHRIYIPFIIAEILSVIYGIRNSDFRLRNIINVNVKRKDCYIVACTFIDLGLMALLTNLMVYFDKLIMYPILGATAVSVYYAANSMSKAINLIINPIYGVILSWLGTSNDVQKETIIKTTLKYNMPVIFITMFISYPITYIALKLLYPQYFSVAFSMILPICISVGFSVANSITKGVLLKFYESRKLLYCNISYFIVFILFSLPLGNYFGIEGFVYANLIARFEQWIIFMWFLIRVQKSI